jgi:hypothetical protein
MLGNVVVGDDFLGRLGRLSFFRIGGGIFGFRIFLLLLETGLAGGVSQGLRVLRLSGPRAPEGVLATSNDKTRRCIDMAFD